MLKLICLSLALSGVVPLWSQVQPAATGDVQDDDTQMMVPPPVSREAYPKLVGSETRSNYLSGGLVFTAAHDDNIFAGNTSSPLSDETYSILPTLTYERKTPRQLQSLTYSAGFSFYQHATALDAVNQSGTLGYQYRVSPHATISVHDTFQQNSNTFSQPNPFTGGGVSGSPQSPGSLIIAPFENQLANTTFGGFNYQFSRNGMIGGDGSYSFLNYGSLTNTAGLYDSSSSGGTAFYDRRLFGTQYLGGIYQYARTETHPVSTLTNTHVIYMFYTIFVNRNLSISLLAGPQHFDLARPPLPTESSAWTPSVSGSISWRRSHTNFAASYSRIVSGGGGLLGAFHTDNAAASARWQMKRTWSTGIDGGYAIFKSVEPVSSLPYQGGHTITGTVSIQHTLGERIAAQAGYARLHQSYGGIAAVASAPDSNREFISVTYQFTRPLGR